MHGDVEQRELPSIPSARQSIHKHENCIFAENFELKMGRYGIKSHSTSHSKLSPEKLDHGVDEVDNIQSKLLPSSSPISYRKYQSNKGRRNSHNIPDSTSDDSEINCKICLEQGSSSREMVLKNQTTGLDFVQSSNLTLYGTFNYYSHLLAKSLPANLPSYYSDEFGDQSMPDNFYNSDDLVLSSSNASSCGNVHNDSCNSQKSEQVHNSKNEFTKQTNMGYKVFGVVVVLVAIVYYYGIMQTISKKRDTSKEEYKFYEEMVKIRKKFSIEDELILEVQTGISGIFEKNDTGSFIFLYNSNNAKFDNKKFSNFMKEIATTAAQFLRKDSASVHPTVVDSSQLNMQSYSELMNRYREEVSKTGVMLINDLDGVPSRLAMAFHYFCDEYNPLVPKTAIFFTLNFSKCSHTHSSEISSYLDVEKCLASKWNTVPKDNIKPLLARVVNVIIDASGIA